MFLDRLREKSHSRFPWDISGQSVPITLYCGVVLFNSGLNEVMNGQSQFRQHWFLSFPVPGGVYHPLLLHVWRTAQEISKQMKDTWPGVIVRGTWHQERHQTRGI